MSLKIIELLPIFFKNTDLVQSLKLRVKVMLLAWFWMCLTIVSYIL